MGLTPLFFEMNNKHVLIIGTGSVGIRRARRFLDVGARVSIITHDIDERIEEEFLSKGAIFYGDDKRDMLLEECDLVVVATDNKELNKDISVKASDKLVNCASDISLSNIIVPSTFKLGSVTVSLYTDSKSPLMAKKLRKKIQSMITPEDILNIELQEQVRQLLKDSFDSQIERKDWMIKINEDENVQKYISKHDLESAIKYVKENFIK